MSLAAEGFSSAGGSCTWAMGMKWMSLVWEMVLEMGGWMFSRERLELVASGSVDGTSGVLVLVVFLVKLKMV